MNLLLMAESKKMAEELSEPGAHLIIEKKKRINYIMFAGVVILVLISIWTFRMRPIETRTLEVNFSVGPTSGIIVDTDKLYFGRIVPGNSVVRDINIENGYGYPLKVKISATPNIRDYLFVEKEFVVEPGSTIKIPININIPEDMPYGDYAGQIRFDLVKA